VKLVLAVLAALALSLTTSAAWAETKPLVILEVHTGWTVIGTKNTTGGFTPSIAATYLWSPSEQVRLGLGVDLGVFGFGGNTRWIGVLGGPTARVELTPWDAPLALTFGLSAGIGRVPVCTPWESPICPRFVGLFPAASIAGMYLTDSGVAAGLAFSARLVNTLIGTTSSYEPSLVIAASFGRK
jgi:hypothetical protein